MVKNMLPEFIDTVVNVPAVTTFIHKGEQT
jgi:hypothetical protein